jgi:hypothetical protein
MGKKWWEYIYIWLMAVAMEEGEPNCKNQYLVFTGWD